MLDSHSQLVVYPEETRYFRRFIPEAGDGRATEVDELVKSKLLHIFEWDPVKQPPSQKGFADRDYSQIEYEEVLRTYHDFIGDHRTDFSAVLPAVILSYGRVTGQLAEDTKYWVEKTPYNERYATEIFSLWPEAKCIHITRDPRDNYASYQRKHPDWGADLFSQSWLASLEYGRENRSKYGPEHYLSLRYEELVLEPETAIREFVNFLGIRDEPILRTPTRSGKPWFGNSMFGDEFASISRKPVGRYSKALSPEVVERIEFLLNPEMERLGYTPGTRFSTGARIGLKLQRLRWSLRA